MSVPQKAFLVVLALAMIGGCDREATGQVAAVVNGEEITLQELNAEMGAAQVPEGAEKEELQRAALQRIIERRLLAQIAREDGLDETQDYLLRERQLEDALLVQLLGQKAERALQVPDQQEIDSFVEDNPAMFADRKIFNIDRIQFPIPADVSRLKALENDHSMEEVANRLRLLNIDFGRDTAQMDSAQLGQQRMQAIRALPKGEPFVIPENGMVTVGVITGERPAPLNGAQARQLATQAIRNQKLQETLQSRLQKARADAEIDYQTGLAPPPEAPEKRSAEASKNQMK